MSQPPEQPNREAVSAALLVPILAVAAGLGPATLTMTSPSLPSMAEGLEVTETAIALSQAAFLLGMSVPQILFGSISDRFGRRMPFLVGVVLFFAGSLMAMLAPNFGVLLAGRIIQAFGASAGMVTARALLRELFPEEKAASLLGYLTVAIMVVPMISPVLGGYLQVAFGWRSTFAFLTVLGICLLTASWLFIPRVKAKSAPRPRSHFTIYGRLLRSANFRTYTMQISLVAASNQVFFACVPFVAELHFHIPPSEYGKYFAIPALGYMLGNLASGRIVQSMGINKMIRLGSSLFLFMGLVMVTLLVTGHMTAVAMFGLMIFVSFSHGLIMPSAVSGSTGALEEGYGSAAGLSGFSQTLSGAAAVLIVMPLLTMGPAPVICAVALAGVLSFSSFWFLAPPVRARPSTA